MGLIAIATLSLLLAASLAVVVRLAFLLGRAHTELTGIADELREGIHACELAEAQISIAHTKNAFLVREIARLKNALSISESISQELTGILVDDREGSDTEPGDWARKRAQAEEAGAAARAAASIKGKGTTPPKKPD